VRQLKIITGRREKITSKVQWKGTRYYIIGCVCTVWDLTVGVYWFTTDETFKKQKFQQLNTDRL